MKRIQARLGLLAAGALALSGCATICNSAGNAAGNTIGSAIGNKVGDAVVATYSPMFLNFYYGYIFTLAFGSHGYDVADKPFKPGEWVSYQVQGHSSGEKDEKPSTLKRAFLFTDKEGNEYWQVKFIDGNNGDTLTLEAMFDKGRTKVLRMRSKMPKDTEAKEVPVNDQTYYYPPQKLTKQSLAGAKVGVESLTVPAGTFKATHYKFAGGAGTDEWWVVPTGVPGGVVQYRATAPQQQSSSSSGKPEEAKNMDPNNWTQSLKESGTGATSELGMKPTEG